MSFIRVKADQPAFGQEVASRIGYDPTQHEARSRRTFQTHSPDVSTRHVRSAHGVGCTRFWQIVDTKLLHFISFRVRRTINSKTILLSSDSI